MGNSRENAFPVIHKQGEVFMTGAIGEKSLVTWKKKAMDIVQKFYAKISK